MVAKLTPVSSYTYWRSRQWVNDSPPSPWVRNGSGKLTWGNNEQNGGDDPNWRNKVIHGQASTNYYIRRGFDVSPGYLSGEGYYVQSPSTVLHCDGWGSVVDAIILPRGDALKSDAVTRDLALGRLRNRLGNESQTFNALVPLGEIGQLRQLISSGGHGSVVGACTTLVNELLNIKRLVRNPRRAFKAAQNAWLTWSFGVKPTLADVSALGNSIDNFFSKPERTVRISGSATREWLDSKTSGSITGTWLASYGGVNQLKYEIGYKFIAGHRFYTRASNDYSLLDQLGFNIPNLVPSAWELIPYSWIVDYFSTAGQFLEDNFTAISGQSIYCLENRRFSVESRGTPQFNYDASDPKLYFYTKSARPWFARYFELERIPLSAIPARSLRFKSIDEIGINGVNRLLNLASLLRF